MAIFGGRSNAVLKTLDPDLARVMSRAIEKFDFMLIQGARTKEEQEADYLKGTTRAHWLQSPHDYNPSLAVDAAPIPLHWQNLASFSQLAQAIYAAADFEGVQIQWGGNFLTIKDYPHFQLSDWKRRAGLLKQGMA